ncbi:O-antigen ligase [Phenylobacterium sp. LjRoot219]|uniref:O-antigen polymerase n=1 Tax=Phenylobacterium sp. LjRoot219 TaxID=3342283 RepID=UPI003ECFEE21
MVTSVHLLAIVCQLLLLGALCWTQSRSTSVLMYRYFTPAGFITFWYMMYFLIEQLAYMSNGYTMLGMETLTPDQSIAVYERTQLLLIAMLASMAAGSALVPLPRRTLEPEEFTQTLGKGVGPWTALVVLAFFALGIAATIYLGRQFTHLTSVGQFRSGLVKSADGLMATIVQFLGNFAFSVLLYWLVRARRYLLVAGLVGAFFVAILYTGARGRFLWPTLIGMALVFAASNRLPTARLVIAGVLGVFALSIMDPLRKSLVDPTATFTITSAGDFVSDLLSKRNFDGFANFGLISGTGFIEPHLSRLIAGARDPFMMTFFPVIYRSGVAFGSTLPGYFYVAAGVPGVIILGAFYGATLQLINLLMRSLRSVWLLFAYMYAMMWYCAVGADFVESRNKMLAAMAPGLILWGLSLLGPLYQAQRQPRWSRLRKESLRHPHPPAAYPATDRTTASSGN